MNRKTHLIILLAVFCAPLQGLAADKCLICHEGIEPISEDPEMHDLECTDCHYGNADAETIEEAHEGMFANPSDLRVIDKTCADCHEEVVDAVLKSLHATSAGKISGTRYGFGLQDVADADYANYAIEDDTPEGPHAVASFKGMPVYDPNLPESSDNHPGMDYLRNQCLRCHIWSDGHKRDGDYRASGCAACHMEYSDAGLYEGGDKAIPKDQKDRPRFHRITSKIGETQCIHCHNRGGRTGVSFIGTIESDGYGTPWRADGSKQPKLHGKYYNHLQADIHFEKGMTCIDCHTVHDMHGDGNLYLKREHAVEIECEDCHGTMEQVSDLTTSKGNPMENLKRVGDQVILTTKLTGEELVVTQLATAELTPEAHAAKIAVPSHMEKMECYACHAKWAPQCYGCHTMQDIGKPSGDWLAGKECQDPSRKSMKGNRQNISFAWSESRSYVRWEDPTLGINTEGKVSPFIPGCQVFFTQMDGTNGLVNNKVFTTRDGTSGLMHAPIQPHTIASDSRTCTDCHASTKALGLGGGIYDVEANFPDGKAPIDFELERIVDEEGNQLQGIAHEGARPFTKEEMQRISRVGACTACHNAEEGNIWEAIRDADGEGAPNDDLHQEAIRKLIGQAD